MGPITHATDAMRRAQQVMRDHNLVTPKKCLVCKRALNPGCHTSDCEFVQMDHAIRRLGEFLNEITS